MIQHNQWQLGLAIVLAMSGLISANTSAVAQSNIVPDNTLGAEPSSVIPNFNGLPVEAITGGAQRGQNLFHSFREFNVSTGRGAYFFSPDAAIQNILARVTGNNRSEILGTLGTFGNSQPNLFLINPNGIIFGPNASLDVRGSFVATTANAVQFGNQGSFSATNPQPPTPLLTINPSAFFFTARERQGEIINQSQATQTVLGGTTNGLRVRNGRSLLLLGGNVTVDGGQLVALGGRVEVGAVAGTGTVELNANGSLSVPNEMQQADVVFTNQAFANVRLDNGGDIGITARNIGVLEDSFLEAGIRPGLGFPTSQAGDIVITAQDCVSIEKSAIRNFTGQESTGNGGNIQITTRSLMIDGGEIPTLLNNGSLAVGSILATDTSGTGNSGNIIINAQDQVLLDRGGAIVSQALGAGNAGDIHINTGSLTGTNISVIQSVVAGQGKAGNVTVNARDHILFSGGIRDNFGSGIASQVLQNASGEGGDIDITTGSLILQDKARLSVGTLGNGDAGNVQINVRDEVRLESSSSIFSAVDKDAVGNGGNIEIAAGSLTLLGGSQLDASTFGRGSSGDILINVRDTTLIDGVNPTLPDRSSTLFSEVFTGAEGNGGNIYVSTGSLLVTNGGQLDAKTRGRGNAGSIFITARDQVIFDGLSPIDGKPTRALSRVDREAIGNGGNIQISAETLSITNGAILTSETLGQGNAGSVAIDARDSVIVKDRGEISARTSSAFKGGDITITTNNLQVKNGTVTVNSQRTGVAGSITLNAQSVQLSDRGRIIAEAASQNGGDIVFNVSDLLLLRNGSRISTTAGTAQAPGNGGNITINAPRGFIVGVKQENSDITANAFTGNGGRINITAQGIYGLQFRPQLTPFSDITASSQFGVSGVVLLNTPDVDPSRGLLQLPVTLADASQQILQTCVPRGPQRASSFIITGRGGIPASPTEPLQDESVLTDWVSVDGDQAQDETRGQRDTETRREPGKHSSLFTRSAERSRRSPHSSPPTEIVEANSWIREADGTIALVAVTPTPVPRKPVLTPVICP